MRTSPACLYQRPRIRATAPLERPKTGLVLSLHLACQAGVVCAPTAAAGSPALTARGAIGRERNRRHCKHAERQGDLSVSQRGRCVRARERFIRGHAARASQSERCRCSGNHVPEVVQEC